MSEYVYRALIYFVPNPTGVAHFAGLESYKNNPTFDALALLVREEYKRDYKGGRFWAVLQSPGNASWKRYDLGTV